MLNLDEAQFFKHHALIRGISETVHSFGGLTPISLYAHMGELQYLKKGFEDNNTDSAVALCGELQESFAWLTKVTNPITMRERQKLITACDELRLHVVSSALSVAVMLENGNEKVNTILEGVGEKGLAGLCGPIVHGRGGLVHAVVGSTRVIILPRIHSETQCHEIYEEFLSLLEYAVSVESWVMDCSMLTELPALLLANLIVYAQKLRIAGDDLHLSWIRPSFFSELQLPRVINYFGLKKIGGYYFSVPDSPW